MVYLHPNMLRLLIEVTHENTKEACDRAIEVFKNTGSHFLTNADWGCKDDVHKAWIIVDMDSKEEALRIVPPSFRQQTKIITLYKFALETANEAIKHHKSPS